MIWGRSSWSGLRIPHPREVVCRVPSRVDAMLIARSCSFTGWFQHDESLVAQNFIYRNAAHRLNWNDLAFSI